jgi:hypothetical protein
MATSNLPSPEELRKHVAYDPETGALTWRTGSKGHRAGAAAFTNLKLSGYLRGRVLGVDLLAHRAAWAIYYGEWPEDQIDHINGNRADNRITNMRDVSPSENRRNAAMSMNNTSGYNGVGWDKRAGKWRAVIGVGGRIRPLGRFANLDEAIAARKAAEVAHGFHENHGRIGAFGS